MSEYPIGYEEGTEVIPNSTHRDYEKYLCQHKGCNGKVTGTSPGNVDSERWVKVAWSNGHVNVYPISFLIKLDGTQVNGWEEVVRNTSDPVSVASRTAENEERFKIPFLSGMRVCLNPDSANYQHFNETVKGNAGYVIRHGTTEGSFNNWKDYPRKQDIITRIRFDNDVELAIKYDDLLKVDSKPKDITVYKLSHSTMYQIGDEPMPLLDKFIIQDGYSILEKIVYDDKWREKMIEKALSQSTAKTTEEYFEDIFED